MTGLNVPLNIDWHQILLHLFNFTILAGGLYLLLYKPVKDFMDKRTAYYQALEDAANEKLSHASALEADYQSRMDSAEDEITRMKAKAVKESEAAAAAMLKSAKEQSEKLVLAARDSAELEHKRMISEAREEIAQIAVAATKKLLEENSSKIYDDFLDAAAKEQDSE